MASYTIRLLVFHLLVFFALRIDAREVKVSTSRGVIYGFHVDYGNDASSLYFGEGDAFLGIPYARAPIGHLRFASTKPLLKFKTGKYNATHHAKYCPQGRDFNNRTMSENCLRLNIFTPTMKSGTRYPVMFYIHSGGFISGNGRELDMPGAITNFVSRGVIVVTIQYRIGVLGFFTTNTDDFPANRGLHDAAVALQWIHDEIGAFGGDNSKITIFGVSAGSSTVAALTLSPLTRGLIHQAIMQSGGSLSSYDNYVRKSLRSESIAQSVCNVTEEEWKSKRYGRLKQCMETATLYNILANDDEYSKHSYEIGWSIGVDKIVLPDSPEMLAKQRPNIPVIMGTARDEFYAFIVNRFGRKLGAISNFNSTTYKTLFYRIAGNITKDAKITNIIYQLISAIYVNHSVPALRENDHGRWLKASVDTLGGLIFIAPTAKEIEWYRNNNNTNIFIYQYEYESNLVQTNRIGDWKPVIHGEDRCFLFLTDNCWKTAEKENRTTPMDHVIADRFGQLWTNFAKTGSPSQYWQPFDGVDSFKYYAFSYNGSMQNAYADKHRYAWNDIVRTILSGRDSRFTRNINWHKIQ